MRLICVQRAKLQPLVQIGAHVEDLTPEGLWDTPYHVVSMSDEQFEAFQKLVGDDTAYQDITPKSLIRVAATHPGSMYCRGGQIPNCTKLRATYLSRDYLAEVKGGHIWYDGKTFDSPSHAARAITKGSVNGWTFWEYWEDATQRWLPLDSLRSKKK